MNKRMACLFVGFALALIVFAPASELRVEAAAKSANTTETRYIRGDGVRLRKEGWTGGTVLELMYDGEQIKYYPYVFGSDPEYNYMQRNRTGTYGYVDHHYTRMTK